MHPGGRLSLHAMARAEAESETFLLERFDRLAAKRKDDRDLV